MDNKSLSIFEDCPELFRSAVSVYIKMINTICKKYEATGECYDGCPLYGKCCGITQNATDQEINEVLNIIYNFDEEKEYISTCSCGYIFNSDDDYKFCPYCGAEKP